MSNLPSVSVDFNPAIWRDVEDLAERTNKTPQEIIGNSIGIMKTLVDAHERYGATEMQLVRKRVFRPEKYTSYNMEEFLG